MLDRLRDDATQHCREYIRSGRKSLTPLPLYVRNVLAHQGTNQANGLADGDLNTAIRLLRDWLQEAIEARPDERGIEEALPAGSISVKYNCYGGGRHLDPSALRHRSQDAFIQLTNEFAAGLRLPLILSLHRDSDFPRLFANRLKHAAHALAAQHPDALLVVTVDAADNAVVAAQDRMLVEASFVHDFVQLTEQPENVRWIVTARTGRFETLQPPLHITSWKLSRSAGGKAPRISLGCGPRPVPGLTTSTISRAVYPGCRTMHSRWTEPIHASRSIASDLAGSRSETYSSSSFAKHSPRAGLTPVWRGCVPHRSSCLDRFRHRIWLQFWNAPNHSLPISARTRGGRSLAGWHRQLR